MAQVNILPKQWLLRDKFWMKYFERAVELELHHCLQNMIDSKVQISKSVCNKEGNTALHIATKANMPTIVDKLMDKMDSLNGQNFQGKTSLHLAVENDLIDIVKMLINKEADLNSRDVAGHTPRPPCSISLVH